MSFHRYKLLVPKIREEVIAAKQFCKLKGRMMVTDLTIPSNLNPKLSVKKAKKQHNLPTETHNKI